MSGSVTCTQEGSRLHLVVGSLNRHAPYFLSARGPGITVFSFDPETGTFTERSRTTDVDNPTYLAVSQRRQAIYAVSEVFGWKEGDVSSYHFDAATGSLAYRNKQPTLGSISAHVSLDQSDEHVFVANYAKGQGGPDQSIAAFAIGEDGGLGPAFASVRHADVGIRSQRQERPHAHCIVPFGNTNLLLVTDLGLDQIIAYRLDGAAMERLGSYAFADGAGPRHIAVDAGARRVFVINELDSMLVSLSLDGSGQFERVDMIKAVPDTPAPRHHCAHISLTADCRFIYTSDRGRNLISAFKVSPEGKLTLIEHYGSGGLMPRHFALTPDERFLLAANQNSDEIAIFLRDPEDGRLTDTGNRIPVGTPMCVAFLGPNG